MNFKYKIGIIIVIAIFLFSNVVINPAYSDSVSNYKYAKSSSSYSHNKVSSPTLPRTGIMVNYTGYPCIAPFRILSTSQYHCYMKLLDANTGELLLTIFIRAGETANLEIPVGDYDIKLAQGYKWYGTKNLFGPGTICTKFDEILSFCELSDRVRGHTITLYRTENGNLELERIDPKDF